MRTALRALEGLLLDGGRHTARRNAWHAVLEDRRRAQARAEADRLLTAMPAGPPAPTSLAVPAAVPVSAAVPASAPVARATSAHVPTVVTAAALTAVTPAGAQTVPTAT